MSKPLTVSIIGVESYLSPWKYSTPVLDSHISLVMLRHLSLTISPVCFYPFFVLLRICNQPKMLSSWMVVHLHVMQMAAIRIFLFYRSFWWAPFNFWSEWKSGKMTKRFNITEQQKKSLLVMKGNVVMSFELLGVHWKRSFARFAAVKTIL